MLTLLVHLCKVVAYFVLTELTASKFVALVRDTNAENAPQTKDYSSLLIAGFVFISAVLGIGSISDALLHIAPTSPFLLHLSHYVSRAGATVLIAVACGGLYLTNQSDMSYSASETIQAASTVAELSVEGAIHVEEPEETAISLKCESFDELMQQAQANYISAAAHELNTPLQSFYLSLDLLKQTELSPAQADIVAQTAVAVDLMKLTIAQAVDAQRLSGGFKLQPKVAATDLSSVVERVTRTIRGYGISMPVSFELAPSVCDAILTDEDWLWQMLTTLLFAACSRAVHDIHVTVSARTDLQPHLSRVNGADFVRGSNQDLLRQPLKEPLAISTVTAAQLLFEVTTLCVDEQCCNADIWPASSVKSPPVAGSGDLGMYTVHARVDALNGLCGSRKINTEAGAAAVVWFAVPYTPVTKTATPKLPVTSPVSVMDEGVCGGEAGGNGEGESTSSSGTSVNSCAESAVVCGLASPTNAHRVQETATTASVCSSPCHSTLSSPAHRTPTAYTPEEEALRQRIRESNLVAMLVEDTVTIRKLMERTLLQMGFAKVYCCENGQLGLEAMLATQVDIVFSDVQMPVMSGDSMVRAFRAAENALLQDHTRTTKQLVVAVTANGAEFGDLLGAGFDLVSPKPVSKKTLFAVIEGYLDSLQQAAVM